MFTPLLVRCGMLLPFLPPLADFPPTECLLPNLAGERMVAGASTSRPPEFPEIAAQAREMVQLRRSLQMSPLSGSILDSCPSGAAVGTGATSSDEAEFAQVLHRVVESTPVGPTPIAPADRSVGLRQPDVNSADAPGFLRNISRQLDDLANDCEEQQDYATADRLRELSDQVRQRARVGMR